MSEQPVRIVIDKREMPSPVPKALEKLNCNITYEVLEVGDYIVSNTCGYERKTPKDFLSSTIGAERGKIFRQVGDLVQNYEKPALLIEGTLGELLGVRNVHPNAILAMIQTIMELGCAVRFTVNAEGTAAYLLSQARKEQLGERRPVQVHGLKRKLTMVQQQEAVVSSILDVGTATAQGLLKHFGSVQAVFNASVEELDAVPDVGRITAEKIRAVVGGIYFGSK